MRGDATGVLQTDVSAEAAELQVWELPRLWRLLKGTVPPYGPCRWISSGSEHAEEGNRNENLLESALVWEAEWD